MSFAMLRSIRKLSKKRLEAADNRVVVVNLQQQGPFVEGGAGMRYVETQKITYRQIRFRRHGQVTMLVVEFDDDQTIDGWRRVVPAFAKPPADRRQVDVVGDVALAHQHDGLVRLRPRNHPRPYFESGNEAWSRSFDRPVLDVRQQSAIEAAVMGHIAAAAQDGDHALGSARRDMGDQVVVSRPAGAEDDLVGIRE